MNTKKIKQGGLAILATIAFLSFSGQSSSARDSTRLSDISNISKGLGAYMAKSGAYPDPESPITLKAGTTTIGYQGVLGDTASQLINMNGIPKDPVDNTKYIYSVNSTKNKYQILGFLENNISTTLDNGILNSLADSTYAIDYTIRYPKTKGNGLGIILDTNNNPLSGSTVDISTGATIYKIVLSNSSTMSGSGLDIKEKLMTSFLSNSKFPGEDGVINSADDCDTNNIYLVNGQIWSACNLGANTAYNGQNSGTFNASGSTTRGGNDNVNGKLYQWGRNKGFSSNDTTQQSTQLTSNPNDNDTFNFVWNSNLNLYRYDWLQTQTDTLWGGSASDTGTLDGQTDDTLRKGPCPSGWHVPSAKDWQDACNSIKGSTCTN